MLCCFLTVPGSLHSGYSLCGVSHVLPTPKSMLRAQCSWGCGRPKAYFKNSGHEAGLATPWMGQHYITEHHLHTHNQSHLQTMYHGHKVKRNTVYHMLLLCTEVYKMGGTRLIYLLFIFLWYQKLVVKEQHF